MGIAVPSLAEASRRLPASVKADQATADDVLVTSVANAPPAAIDEPVSPELALVDPVLRERLRASLPELELEPPPPLLRALPDPAPDHAPLAPPPELVEAPPDVASGPLPVAVREVPVYVFPSRGDRFRSLAKAFALGAAAAAVVTVGVVAELGEGPATPQEPVTTPPRVAAPTPTPKVAAGGAATKKTPKPAAAGGNDKSGAAVKQKPRSAGRPKTQPRATKKPASKPSGAPVLRSAPSKAKETTKPAATPASTPEPRRFAWAPVDGAVGYRFELFRGDEQVLEVRTKTPAYELETSWRHAGKTERLSPGGYKWYVWPVFSSGPAAAAVVQAKLSVP
jgi:hypothetical protein